MANSPLITAKKRNEQCLYFFKINTYSKIILQKNCEQNILIGLMCGWPLWWKEKFPDIYKLNFFKTIQYISRWHQLWKVKFIRTEDHQSWNSFKTSELIKMRLAYLFIALMIFLRLKLKLKPLEMCMVYDKVKKIVQIEWVKKNCLLKGFLKILNSVVLRFEKDLKLKNLSNNFKPDQKTEVTKNGRQWTNREFSKPFGFIASNLWVSKWK